MEGVCAVLEGYSLRNKCFEGPAVTVMGAGWDCVSGSN